MLDYVNKDTHTQMLQSAFDNKMLTLSSNNSIYPRSTVRLKYTNCSKSFIVICTSTMYHVFSASVLKPKITYMLTSQQPPSRKCVKNTKLCLNENLKIQKGF